jgi:TetR/AcrR family transcriptional repressor of nem operon
MVRRPAKRRLRKPDVTREKLLKAAFEEIYRRGFQATSLDAIVASTGVTKGALYHHFPDKRSLGYAVVDEVVRSYLLRRWSVEPLGQRKVDPVTALQRILERRSADLTATEVELGCPLSNLGQEMSPLDEQFRRRISATFDSWIDLFAQALERGQAEGSVRRDVDARKVAGFLVAAAEGSFGLAKSAKSARLLRANLEILGGYLETLRSRRPGPRHKK